MLFLDLPTRSLSVYSGNFFVSQVNLRSRAYIGAFYVICLVILEAINFLISKLKEKYNF